MISRIHGTLEAIENGAAQVSLSSGLTYEVLLPAYLAARLNAEMGQPVTLHTIEFLESTSQGASFTPRLAGFIDDADRAFFEQFTSVKGIGPRKALRSMSLSTERIAAAIADRDAKTLQSLPEIGKRTAETIVITLEGKVDRFLSEAAYGPAGSRNGEDAGATSGTGGGSGGGGSGGAPGRQIAREALEVLLQLEVNRADAINWIDDVMRQQPDLADSQQLISEVLRRKSGV